MKHSMLSLLLLCCFSIKAQKRYSALIEEAQKIEDDTTHYARALAFYEEAFAKYPDSITQNDRYSVSVLAAHLNDKNKAFDYLTPLARMEKDEYGYPGWDIILGENAGQRYKNLVDDKRWKNLKAQALKDKKVFYTDLRYKEEEFYSTAPYDIAGIKNNDALYEALKKYGPYKEKHYQDYSISFQINDTTQTSFFVHLPKNYSPRKKYPLLFFLHGAVRYNQLADFQTAEANLGNWNRYYTQYADRDEVILVFPKGSKQYNWMTSDDGFFMIPEMLKRIKSSINVDDNKIFISGHSNGATGSFSYLMKQPTPFAGFYGFNTYPKVFTGGTFIENIKNRSFGNFSTDEDYYYPPNANDDMTKLMNEIQADYKDHRYNGFPHWFPEFDESEPAYAILFADLKNRKRNPFPKEISWEFDDNRYGAVDWLTAIKLDTLQPKANWHKTLNFKIDKWLYYDDNQKLTAKKVEKEAFDFPRQSGKIKAVYHNNTFRIETSCITSFTLAISPEMVNLKKKVKVYVNGKRYMNKKIKADRTFMLQQFDKNKDREQIWINRIELKI